MGVLKREKITSKKTFCFTRRFKYTSVFSKKLNSNIFEVTLGNFYCLKKAKIINGRIYRSNKIFKRDLLHIHPFSWQNIIFMVIWKWTFFFGLAQKWQIATFVMFSIFAQKNENFCKDPSRVWNCPDFVPSFRISRFFLFFPERLLIKLFYLHFFNFFMWSKKISREKFCLKIWKWKKKF